MRNHLLAIACALTLLLVIPAASLAREPDAPLCRNYLSVRTALFKRGVRFEELGYDRLDIAVRGAEQIVGKSLGHITRGFFYKLNHVMFLSLEANRCMLDPIRIGHFKDPDISGLKDPNWSLTSPLALPATPVFPIKGA